MSSKMKFDIIKNRKKFFILSSTITILGIITLLVFGLHTGIDFKAGSTVDIQLGKTISKQEAQQLFTKAGVWNSSVVLTVGGTNNDHVTARFPQVLNQQLSEKVIKAYQSKYTKLTNNAFTIDTVDPILAKESVKKAIYAVLIACVGIILYVSIRFEWRFAIAAIVALLHDAFIVISLFSIFRWQVNLPFVAAVLTIIGYSINDTIVIFDRIRENLHFAKLKSFDDLSELVNRSIWQTMARSINTIITVLVGSLCLFIFGSPDIKMFSLAMTLGLISGGYSSIFIASPIWLLMKNKSVGRIKRAPAK